MKKYEFTGETKDICSGGEKLTLHRIRALRSFNDVEAGELGGWIEDERNLSHDGVCWVSGNGRVYGNGVVCDNGRVYGNSVVCDNGRVSGNSIVFDNVIVGDYSSVSDYAMLYGNSMLSGYSSVSGYGRVYDNSRVSGNGRVSGDCWVSGNCWVQDNGDVKKPGHVLSIGPIWDTREHITFYRSADNQIWVAHGSFCSDLATFVNSLEDNKHRSVYNAAIELAKAQIDLT